MRRDVPTKALEKIKKKHSKYCNKNRKEINYVLQTGNTL